MISRCSSWVTPHPSPAYVKVDRGSRRNVISHPDVVSEVSPDIFEECTEVP